VRYFIDTEFAERGAGKPIDLISIGVMAEDGRNFYAVNSEFKARHANDWVKKHVLPLLPDRNVSLSDIGFPRWEAAKAWMKHDRIREAFLTFIGNDTAPEFWGWMCGFDYVVVSQLVGFDSWPKGWPYYFRDLQQTADERGIDLRGMTTPSAHDALKDARQIRGLWQRLHAANTP
jgi:hypothetical protein